MKSKGEKIIMVLSVLFVIWFVVSFIDINMHNLNGGDYSKFNLFTLLFNLFRG